MRLLTLATYSCAAPRHGGQQRVNALHRVMRSAGWATEQLVVCAHGAHGEGVQDAGVIEMTVDYSNEIYRRKGRTDASASDFLIDYPEPYLERFFGTIERFGPTVISLEQPWLWPALKAYFEAFGNRNKYVVVYSSHNVEELLLKAEATISLPGGTDIHEIAKAVQIEREAATNADAIVAVSTSDAAHFREYTSNILISPNGMWPRGVPGGLDYWNKFFSGVRCALFVSSAHPPNANGFINCLVRPSLAFMAPDERIIVAGSVGELLRNSRVFRRYLGVNLARASLVGVQDEGGLSSMYELANVVILPITEGGGTSIKTAEALFSRRRIVATPAALRGYDAYRDMPGLMVADSPEVFPSMLKEALKATEPVRHTTEQEALLDMLQWSQTLAQIPAFFTQLVNEKNGAGVAGASPTLQTSKNLKNYGLDGDEAPVRSSSTNSLYHRRQQLLLDVSELVQHDVHTGIQRVTRAILHVLLTSDTGLFRPEPIYYLKGRYVYARRFTERFLGCGLLLGGDDPVEVEPGDIFLGIDLAPQAVPTAAAEFSSLRARGVYICFVVYDILAVLHPEWFVGELSGLMARWLESIVAWSDKLICISRATADDVEQWMRDHPSHRSTPLAIAHFHLGADVAASRPTTGIPSDSAGVMAAIARRQTFLAVSTIEPRKGYAQLLAGFELLWDRSIDANLIVVGKQGWMVEDLVSRLRRHPQLGTRLFWLEGISDVYLDAIYPVATALIVASEGEGFGLPLIEAARFYVPIIARDLPVFREIAGDDAYYFSGTAPSDLAEAITSWMELKRTYRAPLGSRIRWLTWQESVQQLLEALLSREDGRLQTPAMLDPPSSFGHQDIAGLDPGA